MAQGRQRSFYAWSTRRRGSRFSWQRFAGLGEILANHCACLQFPGLCNLLVRLRLVGRLLSLPPSPIRSSAHYALSLSRSLHGTASAPAGALWTFQLCSTANLSLIAIVLRGSEMNRP